MRRFRYLWSKQALHGTTRFTLTPQRMRMTVEAFKDTLEVGLEKPGQTVVRMSYRLSSCGVRQLDTRMRYTGALSVTTTVLIDRQGSIDILIASHLLFQWSQNGLACAPDTATPATFISSIHFYVMDYRRSHTIRIIYSP